MDEPLLKELDRGIKEASLGGRSEAIRLAVREWLLQIERKKKVQKEIDGYRRKPVKPEEFGPLIASQEIPE